MSNTFRSDPFALDEDIASDDAEPVAAPRIARIDPVPVAPAVEKLPKQPAASTKKRGRPVSANPKRQITLRLDADIIEHFRSGGKGWQTRLNAALRKAVL